MNALPNCATCVYCTLSILDPCLFRSPHRTSQETVAFAAQSGLGLMVGLRLDPVLMLLLLPPIPMETTVSYFCCPRCASRFSFSPCPRFPQITAFVDPDPCVKAFTATLNQLCEQGEKRWHVSTLKLASLDLCEACRSLRTLRARVERNTPTSLWSPETRITRGAESHT